MRHRRLFILATLVVLVGTGLVAERDRTPGPSTAGTAVAVSPVAEPAAAGCELFEREAVLDLVRTHRRGEADDERRALARTIVHESRAAGVDPLLVASIVASESSFRPAAISPVGAVGLMQLRPFVARDVAGRVDVEWLGESTLTSPALNVRLGLGYYRELLERFDGDEELALSAYNQGPTRVASRLARGTYRASDYAGTILARYGELAGARPADPLHGCSGAV